MLDEMMQNPVQCINGNVCLYLQGVDLCARHMTSMTVALDAPSFAHTHTQVAAVNACELPTSSPHDTAMGFRLVLPLPYAALG
jgi:hypothetical protein